MTEFSTKLVHGPAEHDNQTGAVNVPVYNSSTYLYPSANAKVQWDYARSGNPTRDYLENQMAELERGDHGFAFSSGMAAIHAVFALFSPGDDIIVGDNIYGGTHRLINQFFSKWGLHVTAVDTQNMAAITAAIKPATKAIYFEPFTNPLLKVSSVRQISDIAKQHGLLTIVDNTFLTPYLQQPLELGADIVLHSATKYLSGHSDVIAGIVVTKTPELSERVYFIQNSIGSTLSPQDANLVRRGIQTLALRMDCQVKNATALATFLDKHESVAVVHYPGLTSDPGYALAQKETRGAGGIISFELADGVDSATFVNHLNLFGLAVSLGAVESLVELPCKMSHAELSPEQRAAAGISDQLIRLAVGIEAEGDLQADLTQALAIAATKQEV